ncbi:MAG: hypothetical protein K0R57_2097 [Paenibacillaceae bacterium]|jgi:hypothetical protein|nr:hypothetical protein [Paenibacillaceae bacterium]
MNIAQAIQYLYPQAVPLVDYIVQDDGPTPALRAGVDGRTRYPIRPLENGETEEIEDIHYRHVIDYNRLTLGVDYDIVNHGPYIAAWNLPEPEPTLEDLQEAWEKWQALPPAEESATPEQRITELESQLTDTQLALTDTYEQLLASQNETTALQVAFVELYEQFLTLADGGGSNG